ncbi:MAG: thiolase family protein [Rhizomicrobium sp.]
MSQAARRGMPPSSRETSRKAAIVGLGETDYHLDYRAERAKAPGYEMPTVERLSRTAFDRALADSGLRREDIDGLSVSFTFGGPGPAAVADMLGLKPRYCIANGNIMAGPLPIVCADIAAGKAETVAMVFSVASRSIGRQFGGSTDFKAEGVPSSYYYYHPWGWSSQAAHWALMFSYYQAAYGVREEDLGAVAMQLRRNAMTEANAVMQAPMSLDDYMASRYIVRPLHIFDICLVNDGAVCLIVTRSERARDVARRPVLVAGWGESKIRHSKMHAMVRERLRPQMQEAGRQALDMAGLSLADIQHFEGYDASTIHLINQVEGYGFTEPGTGLEFCKAGHMAVGGRLPVNTAGGNLSGSYMQGWSQVAEVVRQLRHEAGARQIEGIEVSMSSLVQTDQAHPLIFVRGG